MISNTTPTLGDTIASDAVYPFPSQVFIQDKVFAIAFSNSIFSSALQHRTFTAWTDGSAESILRHRPCASAIVFRNPLTHTWSENVTILNNGLATTAELMAVCDALRTAYEMLDHFNRVVIFTDSQEVLLRLQNMRPFAHIQEQSIMRNLLKYANAMYDAGADVELHCVPGHSGVEGNKRADKLSRKYRKMACEVLSKAILLRTDEVQAVRFDVTNTIVDCALIHRYLRRWPTLAEVESNGIKEAIRIRCIESWKIIRETRRLRRLAKRERESLQKEKERDRNMGRWKVARAAQAKGLEPVPGCIDKRVGTNVSELKAS